MGIISKAIEIGSYADWVSPIVAMVRDISGSPSETIYYQPTPHDAPKTLKEHGVKSWSGITHDDDRMWSVKVNKCQAKFAEYVLHRNGVAVMFQFFTDQDAETFDAIYDICGWSQLQ